ncbi:MAG: lytic polysaccharide monooxygenase [Myxococcales bacterium]|nr:lytic polysaccharide monooxygenase [Myxococcales bacterium]
MIRRATVASILLLPLTAAAHIHLTAPKARTDSLTGDQKDQHCGVANQVRNPARVTTFKPGETITVTWMETIDHPGYFRIAFQPNGSVFNIPAAGNGPPAGFPSVDQTGMTDAATGTIILKDRIPDGTLSTQVTLPMMECANCTLQFIQVMTDKAPYTIDAASDDIYFNCADITLANNAPPPPMVDAGVPAGPDAGSADPSSTTGGCSTSGGGSLWLALGLVGLAATRRRPRR